MVIEWEIYEYEQRERSENWFWYVGGVALLLVILAIIIKNFILAILIILGVFTLMLYAKRKPDKIRVVVSRRGVQIKNNLFPFHTLHSFWVHEGDEDRKLIIQSGKLLMPHLHLPLAEEIDHEGLRDFLLDFLPEKLHEPSVIDILSERL